MSEWKDITSYNRDDKERKPTSYRLALGRLHVTVTSGHIYYKGRWVMHCAPFYDTHVLDVTTKEEAQRKALELVRIKIAEVNADLLKALEQVA